MKNFLSHVLLWVLRAAPFGLAALAIWLPSFVPVNVRALIGWAALSGAGIAAVIFVVMWTLASAMKS